MARKLQLIVAYMVLAALQSPLGESVPVHAQVPWVEVSAGGMVDQQALYPTLMGSLEYALPQGFSAGIRWRMGLQMPVKIYREDQGAGDLQLVNNPDQLTFLRTEGTSNAIQLMATGAYTVAWPLADATVGIAFGGVNVAHRRRQESVTISDGITSRTYSGYSTYTQPAWTGGFFARTRLHLTSGLDLVLNGGYDWTRIRTTTVENAAPDPNIVAVFANGGPWFTAGVGVPLEVPRRDSLTHDYHMYLGASLASLHPFTDAAYNEFNPGIQVQMRFSFSWASWFAETGAYQWSLGDLAYYAGGGILVPVRSMIEPFGGTSGWEWLKLGLFGGILMAHDGAGASLLPALSPRITIDTPWASLTTLFVPVGEASAFGFTIAFPLF